MRGGMKASWVYILMGRTGTLYTGVTSDLYRRMLEHREKAHPGFTFKYDCNRLIYYEEYAEITTAIGREKQIKGWTRAKKIALIAGLNPGWKDLSEDWGKPMEIPENR